MREKYIILHFYIFSFTFFFLQRGRGRKSTGRRAFK